MPTVPVRLRLFASARQAAGTAADTFAAATVGDLLAEARARYGPDFAQVLAGSRVWVNGEEPGDGDATRLAPDDEVAVLPPVSGGAAGTLRGRRGEPEVSAMEQIDAVLAPEFSDRLEGRSTDEVRGQRDECRTVEAAVSYYRRLAQGRIEILTAWQAHRRSGGSLSELVADLPTILAGDGPRSSSTTSRFSVPEAPARELVWPGGEHELVADGTLTNLADLDEHDLDAQLDQLRAFERELSSLRQRIHGVLDRLEGELAAREAADAR